MRSASPRRLREETKSLFDQVKPVPHHLLRNDCPGHAVIDYTGYSLRVNDRLGNTMVIRRSIDKRIAREMGLRPQPVVTATGERLTIWRTPTPEIAVHESIRRQISEKIGRSKAA